MTIELTTYLKLAMDAYNRGYADAEDPATRQWMQYEGGSDPLVWTSASLSDDLFGISGKNDDVASGFFAAAYEVDGQIVLSFRGTDDLEGQNLDQTYGWSLSTGTLERQAMLAVVAYEAVAALHPDKTITVTGHSLGGALAGFVSGIFDVAGQVFDTASWDNGLSAVYNAARDYLDITAAEGIPSDALTFWYDHAYAWLDRSVAPITTYEGMTATHLQGEVLEGERLLLGGEGSDPLSMATDVTFPETVSPGAGFPGGLFVNDENVAKHDLTLLGLRAILDEDDVTAWNKGAKYAAPVLWSDDAAKANGVVVPSDARADVLPSTILRTEIGYSIDDQAIAQFGTAAALDLNNDWVDIGNAEDLGANGIRVAAEGGDAADGTVGRFLADAAVQYAGWLAQNGVSKESHQGVVTIHEDGHYVELDLSTDTWKVPNPDAEGEDDAFLVPKEFFAATKITEALAQASPLLAGHSLIGDHIAFATAGFSGALPADSEGATYTFFGTQSAESITGSEDTDIIFGGLSDDASGDTIHGGDGDDIIVGGGGGDHLYGDEGSDLIIGGGGADIIDGGTDAGVGAVVGTGDNFLVGGAGSDTITMHRGDFAIGGDDDETDTYLLDFDQPTNSSHMEVVVAGSGTDIVKITSSDHVRVALVQIDNLAEKDLLDLNRQALGSLLSGKGIDADVVIINAEASDQIFFNDQQVTGGSYQETDRNETNLVVPTLYGLTGQQINVGGTDWDIYAPKQVVFDDTLEQYFGITSGTGSLFYTGSNGALDVHDYSTPGGGEGEFASLTIGGWTDNAAGIHVVGNGTSHSWSYEVNAYYVDSWDYGTYPLLDNLFYTDLYNEYRYSVASDNVPTLGAWVEAGHFADSGSGDDLIQEQPSNHISIKLDDILNERPGQNVEGDNSANNIETDTGPDTIKALGGNDIINARAGDDDVDAGDGDDTITGGRGSDTLRGGNGDDTYVFDAGDGQDILEDVAGDNDVISLSEADLTTDFTFAALGYDLRLINQNTGDMITVVGQFGGEAVETIADDNSNVIDAGDLEAMFVSGAATVTGTSDNDSLFGDLAEQTFDGLEGDDFFDGGAGADEFLGGDGWDTVGYRRATSGVTVDLTGTLTNTGDAAGDTFDSIDQIVGSNFADIITVVDQNVYSGSGNDTVVATGAYGHDLEGEDGDDNLTGGDASDYIDGGRGNDTILGNGGDDFIALYEGNDAADGGDGDDTIFIGTGLKTIDGGDGVDTIVFDSPATGVHIDLGNSANNAGAAAGDIFLSIENVEATDFGDTLIGGASAVTFIGRDGNDTLTGGTADDFLVGDAGNDQITGGAGADVLMGDDGTDTLNGGDGFDVASYAWDDAVTVDLSDPGNNTGAAEGDVYVSIEGVIGSDYDDTLIAGTAAMKLDGGLGDDVIVGGAGDDVLIGGGGADDLDGGGGSNTASYETAQEGIYLHTGNLSASTGDAAGDTLVNIDAILGTKFADEIIVIEDGATVSGSDGDDTLTLAGDGGTLNGGAGEDTLLGGAGADLLSGGDDADELHGNAGEDTLAGGAGDDWLIGGDDDDTFVFGVGDGDDGIADFQIHDGTASGDVIEIQGHDGMTFASLVAEAAQWGADTHLDLGAGDSVVLYGVTLTDLTAQDFRFVA